jgi:hypothetical protein
MYRNWKTQGGGPSRAWLTSSVCCDEPLRQITEGLKQLVDRKRVERDNYLAAIGDAQNTTVRQRLVELAEKCTKEIGDATAKMAEASKRLDSIDQHRASFEHTVALLELWPTGSLSGFPSEERRLLFRQIGLKVVVAPATSTRAGTSRLSTTYKIQGDQFFSDATL